MTKEKLKEIIVTCYCKSEFAYAIGKTYYNGRVGKEIDKLIEENQLDASHFDNSIRNKERTKYPKITKVCPQCGNSFEAKQGHPKEAKTCSCECSNIYFAKDREPKQQTKSVSCGKCANVFNLSVYNNKSFICDKCLGVERVTTEKGNVYTKKNKCSTCENMMKRKGKYGKCRNCLSKDEQYRKDCSDRMKKRVEEGIHSGWLSRSKTSYPEKFFMAVLVNNNIDYVHEQKAGKYFIDFDIGGKIALEIDGKQHLQEERKIKDEEKDKFLVENGWIVHRIPWNSINSEKGKQKMKEKIDKFLEIYNMYF